MISNDKFTFILLKCNGECQCDLEFLSEESEMT